MLEIEVMLHGAEKNIVQAHLHMAVSRKWKTIK